MILTLNTSNSNSTVRYSTNSFGFSRYFRFFPENKVEDVIVVNNFTTDLDFNIDDNEFYNHITKNYRILMPKSKN